MRGYAFGGARAQLLKANLKAWKKVNAAKAAKGKDKPK